MPAYTPEDVDRMLCAAITAGDVDAATEFYEDGATLVGGDGTSVSGRAAIRARWQELVSTAPTLLCGDVQAVAAGDVVLLQADWTITQTGADGALVEGAGRSLEIVRRQADGSWRYVIDIPNGLS